MRIGVLALQGDVIEHLQAIKNCGFLEMEVRTPQDLEMVDGLIMPGGESTTIGMLMARIGLNKAIIRRVKNGMPIWGTCAGAILLAKEIVGNQKADTLKLMDISITRNAYGRQTDSFVSELEIPTLGKKTFEAVFIRAPKIEKALKGVQTLAQYKGSPVLVRQNNMLASSFHPEMGNDLRVHKYFLKMVYESK